MERSERRRLFLPLLLAWLIVCLLPAGLTLFTYAEAPTLTLAVDGTLVYGDDLTLTATLTGAEIPEGATVTFRHGDTMLGAASVGADGTATLTVTRTVENDVVTGRIDAGTQVFTATYSADESLNATASVTIKPREVSIKNFAVSDRTYDGTTNATATHEGLAGVLEGDTVNLVEGSCHFLTRLVEYDEEGNPAPQAVTLGGFDLSSTHYYNYKLIQPTEVTATILPKDIHIINLAATSRPYDGTTAISLSGGALEPADILSDDKAILGLSAITGRAASASAGTQSVVLDEIILTGFAAGNYKVVVPTVTVVITPAELRLSVEKVIINKGQALPALTAKVEGFIGSESADSLEGFALPAVVPETINTLNTQLTSFTVSYEGGNATANYVFDRVTYAAVSLEIHTVMADSDFYTISVEDLSIWQNGIITITPANGYVSITTDQIDNSTLLESITFLTVLPADKQGENTVTFALRHTDGTVTEPVTLSYKLDTIAPTGNIDWKGQSILTSDGSYRYFSKSAFNLGFTADDGEHCSGIRTLEYALAADGPFLPIESGTAEIAAEIGLYTVWFKITDTAGNVTLLHTDGMVRYSDSTADSATFGYERLSHVSADIALTLNGNTLLELVYGTDTVLTAGEAFTLAEDGTLTFAAGYLETLAAGTHTFTLSFHPLAQAFVASEINDAPSTLTLTLTVTRRAPALADFTVTPPADTTYDGTDKIVTVTAPAGMGEILRIHYFDADGNRLSVAKNAGTYVIKVDLGIGSDYSDATDLVIGELVIAKMKPAAPVVAFDAATGTLSGELERLVVAMNNGTYVPLTPDFASTVTEACILSFYLPGDGLNTVDSELTVITITRATAPTTTPTHETLFATCDGRIATNVGGIEYRHTDESTWHAVEGLVIANLAPGTYEVRIAACGTVLESANVRVTILAAPEFIATEKELAAENQPTVHVKGDLTALAELQLVALTSDPASASEIRSLSAIDLRTTEVIGFFDLTLNGRYSGALTMEITVGERYSGQTLTVLRERADGSVETLALPCENGKITLETDRLSPVLITIPMTTPHGIGSAAWIWVLVTFVLLTIGVCIFFEVRTRKAGKN